MPLRSIIFLHSRFQFTPLREGRLATIVVLLSFTIFQFTPLREGRLTVQFS